MKIEMPSGDTLTPGVSIMQTAGRSNGTYKGNEKEVELKELQVKD